MNEGRRTRSAEPPFERRHLIRTWIVFSAALLVALVTAYLITVLREHGDEDYRATILFSRLEAQSYRLSGLAWQAVAESQITPELAEETEDAKDRLQSAREELEQLHLDRPERSALQEIDEALVTYKEALDEELRLVETGQVNQALEMDEELVDPSFEELKEVLQRASESAGANAQQHNRFANWGSALAFTLAACLIGLLFWLFERARRSAELFRVESLETQNTLLQRSNRELRDFVRVASHDLQEPLRKVRTFGDRLRSKYSDVLDDRGRDYLQRMERALARMQNLMEDLLALSRVTTTQGKPFEPAVDLKEVADEVISDLGISVERTGGRVEVGKLPVIEADRSQMHQLLQNLIGNALKFHKEGETPVVRVYGRPLDKRGDNSNGKDRASSKAQITVEDNGIGFDEEYLEQIFVPFQRLHGRDTYEGTGMGLAICRRIVERHGGDITAESVCGLGTKFVVTLPVEQANTSATVLAVQKTQLTSNGPPSS